MRSPQRCPALQQEICLAVEKLGETSNDKVHAETISVVRQVSSFRITSVDNVWDIDSGFSDNIYNGYLLSFIVRRDYRTEISLVSLIAYKSSLYGCLRI